MSHHSAACLEGCARLKPCSPPSTNFTKDHQRSESNSTVTKRPRTRDNITDRGEQARPSSEAKDTRTKINALLHGIDELDKKTNRKPVTSATCCTKSTASDVARPFRLQNTGFILPVADDPDTKLSHSEVQPIKRTSPNVEGIHLRAQEALAMIVPSMSYVSLSPPIQEGFRTAKGCSVNTGKLISSDEELRVVARAENYGLFGLVGHKARSFRGLLIDTGCTGPCSGSISQYNAYCKYVGLKPTLFNAERNMVFSTAGGSATCKKYAYVLIPFGPIEKIVELKMYLFPEPDNSPLTLSLERMESLGVELWNTRSCLQHVKRNKARRIGMNHFIPRLTWNKEESKLIRNIVREGSSDRVRLRSENS